MPVGTTTSYASLLDRVFATSSPATFLVGSSTPRSLVQWEANQCIGLSLINPSNPSEGAAIHPATSTGSGIRKVTLFVPTYATSTDNNTR